MMDIAHAIVSRLLNEEHFDVHQRTDLFTHTGTKHPDGREIVSVCQICEKEFGADKQYPPDVAMSHGLCRRHLIGLMMAVGRSEEYVTSRISPNAGGAIDWSKVLGPPPAGATPPPKATFWATSGSGGV